MSGEKTDRIGGWGYYCSLCCFFLPQCPAHSPCDLQPQRAMEGTRIKKGGKNETDKRDDEVVCLRRQIGLLPAVSFIIGTVVGSGIFIAPKGVLMNSGSVGLSLLVWVLCGVLSLFGKMNDISADVCFCSTFFLLLFCALKCEI